MKYASLSLVTLFMLGAFAIGCGNSRPHTVDNDVGPASDMGTGGRDTGPLGGNDTGTATHDTGSAGHDSGPGHDAGHSTGSMCTPNCSTDNDCMSTCPAAASGHSYCCRMNTCYLSSTMTCPATGHDSGGGGGCGG
jgi:hypothetical protein